MTRAVPPTRPITRPTALTAASGPEAVLSALGRVIGRVGGKALVIPGSLEVAVSELRAAREGGLVQYATSAVWSE